MFKYPFSEQRILGDPTRDTSLLSSPKQRTVPQRYLGWLFSRGFQCYVYDVYGDLRSRSRETEIPVEVDFESRFRIDSDSGRLVTGWWDWPGFFFSDFQVLSRARSGRVGHRRNCRRRYKSPRRSRSPSWRYRMPAIMLAWDVAVSSPAAGAAGRTWGKTRCNVTRSTSATRSRNSSARSARNAASANLIVCVTYAVDIPTWTSLWRATSWR